jgi:hypothetical protein
MNSETTAFYNQAEAALSRIQSGKAPGGPIERFVLSPPTEHEKQVILAMEFFLSNDRESFLNYRIARGSRMPEMTPETYDKFRDKFRFYLGDQRGALILKWAMLLHDIGKGRGVREPHSEIGATIVRRIFQPGIAPGIGGLKEEEKAFITWIVQHHDVMGNIYTGERVAGYLKTIISSGGDSIDTNEELLPEREKGLAFLQFSMLCDLRGTGNQNAYGIYLTDEKANFWLGLSDPYRIENLTKDLFDYRIRKWTGGPDGSENPIESERLRTYVKNSPSKDKIIKYFGRIINYIVNGYYLLDALESEEIAILMERVVMAPGLEDDPPPNAIKLDFTMGYRQGVPASDAMLRRVKAALRGADDTPLPIAYIGHENTIRVDTKALA